MWVSMLLVTVISALVMNLIDSFRISRRLEAAIILLQQQQESARQMGADS